MSKIYNSVDELIGRTPLLRLTNMEESEKLSAGKNQHRLCVQL